MTRRMALPLSPVSGQMSIGRISGMTYVAATGGNAGSSANDPGLRAPTGATSIDSGAKRRHLRLVRD